jgi:hypothetical protein
MLRSMSTNRKDNEMAIKKVSNGKIRAFVVGRKYFIRTVTHYHTGKLVAIDGDFLILSDAAWIADTGRFYNFLCGENEANEVEPIPGKLIVNKASIIDATEIEKLPCNQR